MFLKEYNGTCEWALVENSKFKEAIAISLRTEPNYDSFLKNLLPSELEHHISYIARYTSELSDVDNVYGTFQTVIRAFNDLKTKFGVNQLSCVMNVFRGVVRRLQEMALSDQCSGVRWNNLKKRLRNRQGKAESESEEEEGEAGKGRGKGRGGKRQKERT